MVLVMKQNSYLVAKYLDELNDVHIVRGMRSIGDSLFAENKKNNPI
jgi:hypothetical protein